MFPPISSIDKCFKGCDPSCKEICTLETTVTTGLEEVAAQELREKLKVDPICYRGRLLFDIPVARVTETLEMHSIDHVNVILKIEPNFQLSDMREKCFEKIYKFSGDVDWYKGIEVWQKVTKKDLGEPFKCQQILKDECCTPKPEVDLRLLKKSSGISDNLPSDILTSVIEKTIPEKKSEIETSVNNNLKDIEDKPENAESQRRTCGPKFRVTCHSRVGSNHSFGSPEAARQFGGGINEMFGWPVDLNNFDVEVLLSIYEDFVYVAISLTKEPLFWRNITHFGPTNLRATVCYNMIRLSKPEPGDVIIDPMCGGSTISMEGGLTYKDAFHLGGDNVLQAVLRSRKNIDHLILNKKKSMCIDVAHWDVTRLPLRDQVADVIICDMPFGKRHGSKADNRVLYFKSLAELARVTRTENGRAVLLTHDKNSMIKNLQRVSSLWKHFSTRTINLGGLAATIFLLKRTGLFEDSSLLEELKNSLHRMNRKRKLPSEPSAEEKS